MTSRRWGLVLLASLLAMQACHHGHCQQSLALPSAPSLSGLGSSVAPVRRLLTQQQLLEHLDASGRDAGSAWSAPSTASYDSRALADRLRQLLFIDPPEPIDNDPNCVLLLAADIRKSMAANATEQQQLDAIAGAIITFLTSHKCLYNSSIEVVTVAAFISFLRPSLSAAVEAFDVLQLTGFNIRVTALPYFHSPEDISSQLSSLVNFTGFLLDDNVVGGSVQAPPLPVSYIPLGGLSRGATEDAPTARSNLFMWYRTDVFQAMGIAPPATWDDLISLAQSMSQTIAASRDASGVSTWPATTSRPVQYAVCLDLMPICKGSALLSAMLASILQRQGASQGFYFDPATMTPLVHNAAMRQALSWIKQLDALNPWRDAVNTSSCTLINVQFALGNCALTIDWDVMFVPTNETYAYNLRGLLGVAQLPGSTRVLKERVAAGGALEACANTTECPGATYEAVSSIGAGGASPPSSVSAGTPPPVMSQRPVILVNRAPLTAIANFTCALATGSRSSSVSQLTMGGLSDFFWFKLEFFTSLIQATLKTVTPSSGRRLSQETGDSGLLAFDVAAWVALGYDQQDALYFFNAQYTAKQHANVAPDIATPLASYFRTALDEAVNNATGGQALDEVMSALVQQFAMVQQVYAEQLEGSLGASFPKMYASSIGYIWASPPPPAPPAGADNQSVTSQAWFIVTIVVVSVALFNGVAVGACCLLHRRHNYQSLFGSSKPPGVGADTTLLVTDIQSSTHLWETLQVHTMDQSVKLHHDCIRKCTLRRGGYESMTEGDSFILAFHTPYDAMRFSIECQLELLQLPWPHDLLAHEEAQPVWVAHLDVLRRMPLTPPLSPDRRQDSYFDVDKAARHSRSAVGLTDEEDCGNPHGSRQPAVAGQTSSIFGSDNDAFNPLVSASGRMLEAENSAHGRSSFHDRLSSQRSRRSVRSGHGGHGGSDGSGSGNVAVHLGTTSSAAQLDATCSQLGGIPAAAHLLAGPSRTVSQRDEGVLDEQYDSLGADCSSRATSARTSPQLQASDSNDYQASGFDSRATSARTSPLNSGPASSIRSAASGYPGSMRGAGSSGSFRVLQRSHLTGGSTVDESPALSSSGERGGVEDVVAKQLMYKDPLRRMLHGLMPFSKASRRARTGHAVALPTLVSLRAGPLAPDGQSPRAGGGASSPPSGPATSGGHPSAFNMMDPLMDISLRGPKSPAVDTKQAVMDFYQPTHTSSRTGSGVAARPLLAHMSLPIGFRAPNVSPEREFGGPSVTRTSTVSGGGTPPLPSRVSSGEFDKPSNFSIVAPGGSPRTTPRIFRGAANMMNVVGVSGAASSATTSRRGSVVSLCDASIAEVVEASSSCQGVSRDSSLGRGQLRSASARQEGGAASWQAPGPVAEAGEERDPRWEARPALAGQVGVRGSMTLGLDASSSHRRDSVDGGGTSGKRPPLAPSSAAGGGGGGGPCNGRTVRPSVTQPRLMAHNTANLTRLSPGPSRMYAEGNGVPSCGTANPYSGHYADDGSRHMAQDRLSPGHQPDVPSRMSGSGRPARISGGGSNTAPMYRGCGLTGADRLLVGSLDVSSSRPARPSSSGSGHGSVLGGLQSIFGLTSSNNGSSNGQDRSAKSRRRRNSTHEYSGSAYWDYNRDMPRQRNNSSREIKLVSAGSTLLEDNAAYRAGGGSSGIGGGGGSGETQRHESGDASTKDIDPRRGSSEGHAFHRSLTRNSPEKDLLLALATLRSSSTTMMRDGEPLAAPLPPQATAWRRRSASIAVPSGGRRLSVLQREGGGGGGGGGPPGAAPSGRRASSVLSALTLWGGVGTSEATSPVVSAGNSVVDIGEGVFGGGTGLATGGGRLWQYTQEDEDGSGSESGGVNTAAAASNSAFIGGERPSSASVHFRGSAGKFTLSGGFGGHGASTSGGTSGGRISTAQERTGPRSEETQMVTSGPMEVLQEAEQEPFHSRTLPSEIVALFADRGGQNLVQGFSSGGGGGAISGAARGGGSHHDQPAMGEDLHGFSENMPDNMEYRCLSWAECVQALWRPVEPQHLNCAELQEAGGALLIFRGLRVRMGMHSGITSLADISTNRAAGRTQYGGMPLKRARQVSDAARGGMVLCSGETYGRLPLRKFENKALIVYSGDHIMSEAASLASSLLALYQGVPAAIHPRLVYLEPVRSAVRVGKDTPSAPVGYVTICFMYVAGAQVLLQELGSAAREAMELFRTECCRELMQVDGYLIEAADGFLLTAFHHPADAVLWALRCQQAMMTLPWPQQLLHHELAEEIFTYVSAPTPRPPAPPSRAAPMLEEDEREGAAAEPVLPVSSPPTAPSMPTIQSGRVAAVHTDGLAPPRPPSKGGLMVASSTMALSSSWSQTLAGPLSRPLIPGSPSSATLPTARMTSDGSSSSPHEQSLLLPAASRLGSSVPPSPLAGQVGPLSEAPSSPHEHSPMLPLPPAATASAPAGATAASSSASSFLKARSTSVYTGRYHVMAGEQDDMPDGRMSPRFDTSSNGRLASLVASPSTPPPTVKHSSNTLLMSGVNPTSNTPFASALPTFPAQQHNLTAAAVATSVSALDIARMGSIATSSLTRGPSFRAGGGVSGGSGVAGNAGSRASTSRISNTALNNVSTTGGGAGGASPWAPSSPLAGGPMHDRRGAGAGPYSGGGAGGNSSAHGANSNNNSHHDHLHAASSSSILLESVEAMGGDIGSRTTAEQIMTAAGNSRFCRPSNSFSRPNNNNTASAGGGLVKKVVCRGLRLKAGCDVGLVSPEVSATTGRMVYRGRVMNRAARIASRATAGHVLTSSTAWMCAQASHVVDNYNIVASSDGIFALKGVTESIELFDCRFSNAAP